MLSTESIVVVSVPKETTRVHNKPIKTQQQFGEELMSHKSAKELLSYWLKCCNAKWKPIVVASVPKETTRVHNKPIKTQQQFSEELMSCKSAKELLSCWSKRCNARWKSIVVASVPKETTRVHNKPIKTQQQFGEELMSCKSTKELLSYWSKHCNARWKSIVVASVPKETTRVHNKPIKTQQQFSEELMSCKSTKELLSCWSKWANRSNWMQCLTKNLEIGKGLFKNKLNKQH